MKVPVVLVAADVALASGFSSLQNGQLALRVKESAVTNAKTPPYDSAYPTLQILMGRNGAAPHVTQAFSRKGLTAKVLSSSPGSFTRVVFGRDAGATANKTSGNFAATDVGSVYKCTNAGASPNFNSLLEVVYSPDGILPGTIVSVVEADGFYRIAAAGTVTSWGSTAAVLVPQGSVGTDLNVLTIVKGKEYTIRITETTHEVISKNTTSSYTVVAKDGDNGNTIANKLVALINKDNHPWTASAEVISSATTGILITATKHGVTFTVGGYDGYDNIVQSAEGTRKTQVGAFPVGTAELVRVAEEQAAYYNGKASKDFMESEFYSILSQVASGVAEYEAVYFTTDNHKMIAELAPTYTSTIEGYIFLPKGASNLTPADLATYLNSISL